MLSKLEVLYGQLTDLRVRVKGFFLAFLMHSISLTGQLRISYNGNDIELKVNDSYSTPPLLDL